MDAMESGSNGWWRPSPGSVYPMLQQLSEEGLVRRDEDGRYEITPQGKEEVEWPSRVHSGGSRSVKGTLRDVSSEVSYLEDLAKQSDSEIPQNADEIKKLSERLDRLVGK